MSDDLRNVALFKCLSDVNTQRMLSGRLRLVGFGFSSLTSMVYVQGALDQSHGAGRQAVEIC